MLFRSVHPNWTPDQVKGALMITAQPAPMATPLSVGVGFVHGARAAALWSPPNPNRTLESFLAPDPTGRVDIFASLPPRRSGFLLIDFLLARLAGPTALKG